MGHSRESEDGLKIKVGLGDGCTDRYESCGCGNYRASRSYDGGLKIQLGVGSDSYSWGSCRCEGCGGCCKCGYT